MSEVPSPRRVLASFEGASALRAAWDQDIARGRLLVPDDPAVEILEPLILDLGLDGQVVASLWARAVFRIQGPGGGLGLSIDEIPRQSLDAVTAALAETQAPAEEPSEETEDDDPEDLRPSGGSDANRPIALRYKELSGPEKIQLALRGGRDARLQVMKEGNPQLLKFLLRNPRMTSKEVSILAANAGSPMDVLKLISDHPQHAHAEAVRVALVKNPRTPITIVRQHIDKLPRRLVAQLAKSEHVRAEVQRLARKLGAERRT